MKQGTATTSRSGQTKVEPRSQGINPAYVSRLGNHVGNHTEEGSTGANTVPMYEGRGLKAPMAKETCHHHGSQGKR